MATSKRVGIEDKSASFVKSRTAEAKKVGFVPYIGNIVQIGYDAMNARIVSFRMGTTEWSSHWDEKSYELAKMSILNGKRLFIIADGDPFMKNITDIYLIV